MKACGEEIRPLIRDALQVLHRLEFADASPYQTANILTRPRLPHQVLLAVGGGGYSLHLQQLRSER